MAGPSDTLGSACGAPYDVPLARLPYPNAGAEEPHRLAAARPAAGVQAAPPFGRYGNEDPGCAPGVKEQPAMPDLHPQRRSPAQPVTAGAGWSSYAAAGTVYPVDSPSWS